MMEKINMVGVLTMVVLILGIVSAFLMGAKWHDRIMASDIDSSIHTCEGRGQVLRLYETYDHRYKTECFGELPVVDIHMNFDDE